MKLEINDVLVIIKQTMHKFFKNIERLAHYGWLRVNDRKISIFQFCPILMKLRTNNDLAILKQNINKFFKNIEQLARYGWLRVIDRKSLNFSISSDFDET